MKTKIIFLIIAFSFIKISLSQNCIAGFTYNANTNSVQFTDSLDTGGSVLCSISWDFGDGQGSVSNNPNHTYNSAGSYLVTLTIETSFDSACTVIGCTDVFIDTVYVLSMDTCSLSLSSTQTNVSVNGGNDGSIDLTVTGFSGNPSYEWSNGAITEDISGLVAGIYTVVVSDTLCQDTLIIEITEPLPCNLNLSSTQTNVSVNGGNDGSIDLTVTGSSGNLSYEWSNGAVTEDISGLVAGIYTVVVSDTLCQDTLIIEITEPLPCNLNLSSTQTNVSVNGGNDGSIDLTVTGAYGAVSYMWDNGAITEDISGLIAGVYTVVATDSLSCQSSLTVTITEPSLPPVQYGIKGSVYAKTALLPTGMALLVDESHSVIEKNLIQNGTYQFMDIALGQYYIYVVPYFGLDYEYYPRYFSTYYGEEAFWSQAQVIDVDSVETANINLLFSDEVFYGNGHICGQIQYDSEVNLGAAIFNENWFAETKTPESVYAQNLTCLLINNQNEVVDYCLSNSQGEYYFDNVPFGSYKIHVEYSGKLMSPIYVELSAEKDTVCDLGMTISENNIINVEERITKKFGVHFWPNPFSDNIKFQIQNKLTYKDLRAEVIDVYGRQVLKFNLIQNIDELETSDLEKGVYLIRLMSGGKMVYSQKILKK